MNLFPHCYGETRNRTGIFFCTVAVMKMKKPHKNPTC